MALAEKIRNSVKSIESFQQSLTHSLFNAAAAREGNHGIIFHSYYTARATTSSSSTLAHLKWQCLILIINLLDFGSAQDLWISKAVALSPPTASQATNYNQISVWRGVAAVLLLLLFTRGLLFALADSFALLLWNCLPVRTHSAVLWPLFA